jgi:hypothetical protein
MQIKRGPEAPVKSLEIIPLNAYTARECRIAPLSR